MCVCYVTMLYFSYNVHWQEFLLRRWWLPKKEALAIFGYTRAMSLGEVISEAKDNKAGREHA